MASLNYLRNTRTLVRLVLAWFVLSLGVAIASPVVNPQAMELVCSANGAVKLIVKTDDGTREVGSHSMDCPLCLMAGAPPPAATLVLPPHQPLAHAVTPFFAAYIQAATAAPLSARAPPAL